MTTAEGTMNLLYAPLLREHGYALPMIGTLSGLFAVFQLISRVPSGAAYRAETSTRQRLIWLVVYALTTSGFYFVGGEPIAVVLLTMVHGYAFGAISTLNLAVIIDLTGGKRAGATMGWYTAALSAGYAAGAFLGGLLGDSFGIPIAIAILGALPLLGVPLTVGTPAYEGVPRSREHGPGLRGLFRAHLRLDPRVWLAFLIVLYINLLSDAVDIFFPLYGLSIGVPLAASGALKGLKSGAATFIRFVSGGILRYLDHRAVNVWGVVLFAVATVLIPVVGGTPLLAGLFLAAGLSRGILRVTSAASIAELRAEGQDVGVASGVYNAGLDIGAIIGPALGGVLGAAFGLGPMFQIVACASVALYFAAASLTRAGRKTLLVRGRPAG
ncbi:MAG: MFS transporter [Candidatus Limnocylindria bacterium]|nr:MFS transporter [Candidatus Limnocylindria bacterium]